MTAVSDWDHVEAMTTPNVSSTAKLTATASIGTQSVSVASANTKRLGLYIYNNSANSVYINFGATANSSTAMCVLIATFATWVMPGPIYTGQISGIRNAGTGTLLVTELTA